MKTALLFPFFFLIMFATGCSFPFSRPIDPKSLEGRTILDIGQTNGHILYLVPKNVESDQEEKQ